MSVTNFTFNSIYFMNFRNLWTLWIKFLRYNYSNIVALWPYYSTHNTKQARRSLSEYFLHQLAVPQLKDSLPSGDWLILVLMTIFKHEVKLKHQHFILSYTCTEFKHCPKLNCHHILIRKKKIKGNENKNQLLRIVEKKGQSVIQADIEYLLSAENTVDN